MNPNLKIIVFSATILSIFYILGSSVFRKPFSSTKLTFSIFGLLLIVWNLFEFAFVMVDSAKFHFPILQTVFSLLTFYSLVVYSLHFPYFSRREQRLTYFSIFLGGVGYTVFLHALSSPYIEQKFPLDAKFYVETNHFLSRGFTVLCLMSFIVVAFYKLTNSIQRLRKILFRSLFAFVVLLVFLVIANSYLTFTYDLLSTNIDILFLDICFLITFALVLIQFRYVSFYPGILSFLYHGEIPRLVIQNTAPATPRGIAFLKNELWRMYEVENWSGFVSEFWFSIIIDETLDNALEHGGKRSDDEVTIQIFESGRYIDFYIMDMGKGFDPETVPDPSRPDRKVIPTGRGIYILKKLFQIDWNFLGNEVRVRVSKNPADNPQAL